MAITNYRITLSFYFFPPQMLLIEDFSACFCRTRGDSHTFDCTTNTKYKWYCCCGIATYSILRVLKLSICIVAPLPVTSTSNAYISPKRSIPRHLHPHQQSRKEPPPPKKKNPAACRLPLAGAALAFNERAWQGIVEIIITVIALVNTSEMARQGCSVSQSLLL